MMDLDHIQRSMFNAVRQPLTAAEGMRQRSTDGRSMKGIAEEIIKPNDRLTSFERLEIYNRQYWFRVLGALSEDFEGLRLIIGDRAFEKLSIAYLQNCPSRSFTLRNLGSRLESWLRSHTEFVKGVEEIAIDMVRLEWAEIESFDEAAKPKLTEADLATLGPDPQFSLQPHLRLLDLRYPVDQILLRIRRKQRVIDIASNAVADRPPRRRRPAPSSSARTSGRCCRTCAKVSGSLTSCSESTGARPRASRPPSVFKRGSHSGLPSAGSRNPLRTITCRTSRASFNGRIRS